MPFTPKTWQNGPGGGTPISAAALNDLETRVSTAALPDANDVGYDVFLIAGQSNAAGRGVAYDLARADVADPRIFVYGDPAGTYYPSQIAPAVEPVSAYSPENAVVLTSTAGMSFAIPFARWYVRTVPTNRMVLLVNAAWGGTAFEGAAAGNGGTRNWKVSTTGSDSLYQASITQTLAALAAGGSTSRLVGVLWHQGEQDASNGTSGATYATDLDALIDGYRTALGNSSLPFILGQQTAEALSSLAARRTIDAKHIDTPRRKLYTAFVYNVGTGLTDATNGTLHFSAVGQRLFGKKFFDALARAKANALGALAPAPVVSVSAPDTTSVVATWTQPTGRVTDFLIEYNQGAGWTAWTHTASIDVTATITGLTAGSTVQVRVSSVNEAGTGTPSSVASVTLGGGAGVPGQVTGLALGTATSSTQPLSWTAVSGATGYTVQYALAGSGTWTTFASGVTGTSSTVTGLTASTSYDYRVTATNASGSGTPSSTVTGSTAAASGVDVDALLAEAIKRYRVSDITGVADGGSVASWGSLSSTGSTQPTLDATNGEVVFNGTNNRLDDTAVTQTTGVTAVVVGRLTSLPSTVSKNCWILGAATTGSSQQQMGAALSNGQWLASSGANLFSGTTADLSQHVLIGVFGSSGALNIDGTEVTGTNGTNARAGIRIGCSAGSTPTYTPSRIKQAIFWNRVLTATERAALSTYLQANPA